ncbi:unnamed protein product [Linum trigynum]|uniref:Farnesyl pyrophosphate synthase n=1 Tax=Linum trigynum TaxID=586398 RepID=A0AAV2EFN9_9ROSI
MADAKSKFMEVYSILKTQIFEDPAFEFDSASRQWVDSVMDYNIPKGKLVRGLSVLGCYKTLREGQELTEDEVFLACVLGWCIEWFQGCALIIDDIVDRSHMRRGQPCWHTLPGVGMIAVNDALVLRNHIGRMLKLYFRKKPYYVDLVELFNEVEFQSISGQMIDLITTNDKDLAKYSLTLYNRITEYKSAYYSLYLPVACALILAGENIEDHSNVKGILVEITAYFQIQNDYLDCYGDPKVTGKVGTDIEDRKCSWLVVKALELANEEQKKLLQENYGQQDPACVAKVKELYDLLDLQSVYSMYEKETYEKLSKWAERHSSKVVKGLWMRYAEGYVEAARRVDGKS